MRMKVSAIKVSGRIRQDAGDLELLARSIAEVGQLQPIVVSPDGELLAGWRRLAAVRDILGRDEIDVVVYDSADPRRRARVEWDENVVRKPYTWSELVAVAEYLLPLEREAARARQLAGKPSDESSEGRSGEAMVIVARELGVSQQTLRRAREVIMAAREAPELYSDLARRMDEEDNVRGPWLELQRRRQQEADNRFAQSECGYLEDGDVLTASYKVVCEGLPADLIDCVFVMPSGLLPEEWGAISELAARVLKPGGDLIVLSGVAPLADHIMAFSSHLDYDKCIAVIYKARGGIERYWDPLLVFHKAGVESRFNADGYVWNVAGDVEVITLLCAAYGREGWVLDCNPAKSGEAIKDAFRRHGMKYIGVGRETL